MNAIAVRVSKLEKKIEEMSTAVQKNNKLFEELIEILRPNFPRENSTHSTLTITQTSDDGKIAIYECLRSDYLCIFCLALTTAVAPVTNPDLFGARTIPLILSEARLYHTPKKSNVTPSTHLRILALINYFNKEKNIFISMQDQAVKEDYRVLQAIARSTHLEMLNRLRESKNDPQYHPAWSAIPDTIRVHFSLVLEKKAMCLGFPLHQCVKCWAADRLLYEVHKHRKGNQNLHDAANQPLPETSR